MKKFGIDISAYQEPSSINYDVLAKNIDFAILRAGFSGWGDQTPHKDDYFEKHYQELHRRGVPLGAYYFSTADTVELARKEANAFLEYIKGKEFSYPIYLDVEDEHNQAKLSKKALTDVCIAFIETLENSGYYAGIYASTYWLNNHLDLNRFKPYDLWVAQWSDKEPSIRHGMWQYTSDGSVPGYKGRLDCNYAYQDYPAIIKGAGLNGFKKQVSRPKQESKPKPQPKKTVAQLADEVLAGKWGNGEERKNRLTKAGYSYEVVQNEVNKRFNKPKLKSVQEVAKEVLAGEWGNGTDRRNRLTKAGYNYEKVQAEVNKQLNNQIKTYKVLPGDSWWLIAEKVYGNGQKMYELAQKNGKTINSILRPGDVIKY